MLTLSPQALEQAITFIVERRLSGKQSGLIPETYRPQSLEDALAIQQGVAKRWCETQDDSIGGWKCLQPSEDKWVIAPIFTSTINSVAPITLYATNHNARIEPELGFYLNQDLPAREQPYTTAEIDSAIGRTHLALELIQNRYLPDSEPSFIDNLADNLVNQGIFVGPEIDGDLATQAAKIPLKVTANGAILYDVVGEHPNLAPRLPIYWLVNFLASRGLGLEQGQIIITGSYAGIFEVPLNTSVTIDYEHLGNININFLPHNR